MKLLNHHLEQGLWRTELVLEFDEWPFVLRGEQSEGKLSREQDKLEIRGFRDPAPVFPYSFMTEDLDPAEFNQTGNLLRFSTQVSFLQATSATGLKWESHWTATLYTPYISWNWGGRGVPPPEIRAGVEKMESAVREAQSVWASPVVYWQTRLQSHEQVKRRALKELARADDQIKEIETKIDGRPVAPVVVK